MLENVLHLLQAAYRFDVAEPEWLTGVVAAVHQAIGCGVLAESRGGLGAMAFMYRIDQEGHLSPLRITAIDTSERFVDAMSKAPAVLPPWYVRGTFGRFPCSLASEVGGSREQALTRQQMAAYAQVGWQDVFVVNALDPTDHGVWIGLPLARKAPAISEVVSCWTKIAVHLAAAMRLRRRLAGESSRDRAEAVIEPRGAIAHAQGIATSNELRRRLADAARGLERLRESGRRRTTSRALRRWKELVDARWTLVDHFEADGKRYFVAQCNEVPTRDISCLTARERQVLAFARLGHTNKLIAYELGLSPYTIGVFLHHAARKLGARSRGELIAKFERLAAEDGKGAL